MRTFTLTKDDDDWCLSMFIDGIQYAGAGGPDSDYEWLLEQGKAFCDDPFPMSTLALYAASEGVLEGKEPRGFDNERN